MLNKILGGIIGGLLLYGVASVAYQAGRDSVEPIRVHGPEGAPFISPEAPKSSGSKIGLLFKLNKAFGKKSTSGLKDLLNDPDDLHFESYYEDGVLKVNIKKRTA